jgi:iron complex outermembrane receptor protein
VGSFDERGLVGHFTGPLTDDETLLYRLDAEFEDSGSFRDNQESDFIQVTGALTWRPNEQASLRVEGGVLDETLEGRRERGIPFVGDEVFAVPTSFTSHEETDFFKTQVYYGEAHFDYRLNEAIRFDASTRYYRNDSQEEYHEPRGVEPDTTDFDGDGNTDELLMRRNFRSVDREREGFALNANTIADVSTGAADHKILFGGDVLIEDARTPRWERAFSELDGGQVPAIELFSPDFNPGLSDTFEMTDSFFDVGDKSTRLGVYVQDQMTAGPWQLTGAVRFERFDDDVSPFFGEDRDFSDSQFTFRGGLLYKARENWSLYASYNESYETQPVGQQDEEFGGPFDPEESWQIEAGTKVKLFGERLLATVAGYRIVKDNVLATSPDNPDLLEALGTVRSRGVEIEAVGNITNRLRISGNYAFNDIEVTEDSDPDRVGETFPNAPSHQASLWTSYAFLDGDFTVSGGPTYVSERETFSSPPNIPEYVRIDATAGYRYESFTVRLNVENVTDSTYLTGGFGGRNGGLPGAPRNVTLGVEYGF